MPPLNKVWNQIEWAYVSSPITATCLMQTVPHNGIHYCQTHPGSDVALFYKDNLTGGYAAKM